VSGDTGEREELRRRYRDFIRCHHPDVGGDRDDFERGLAELRASLAARPANGDDVFTAVTAHRSPGERRAMRRWWRRRGRKSKVLATVETARSNRRRRKNRHRK
jgi:hypothetical protein